MELLLELSMRFCRFNRMCLTTGWPEISKCVTVCVIAPAVLGWEYIDNKEMLEVLFTSTVTGG